MTKFFNKFKKPGFWPIFPDFWGKKKKKTKKKNPKKSGPITYNLIWVFSTMPKFRKKQ